MAIIEVNGLNIGYEIVGNGSKTAIITPGGRFPKETPKNLVDTENGAPRKPSPSDDARSIRD